MDLTVLAADATSVPMNLGALIVFDGPAPPPRELLGLLGDRIPRIPRLRQILRRTPAGCGRPVWVDDPSFTVGRHIELLDRPDEDLLAVAASLLCRPLDPQRPLWRAALVAGQDGHALVVVLHHVVADGLGGLAVLAALADESADAAALRDFPLPPPTARELASDAARARLRALRSLPGDLRRGVAGLRELGVGRVRPRMAERLSLVAPTSRRRALTRVTVALEDVVTIAHRYGGTVNDVVLCAVTGAMLAVLRARGEHPGHLIVSVPVSGRTSASPGRLGNNTGVRPISVPAIADDAARLAAIVAATREQRLSTARAVSAGPLSALFRILHRTGLFRMFIEHQRLVHTFETNVRGLRSALHLAGSRIGELVPMVATPGNAGVTFAALSYAGALTVCVITDPGIVPERQPLAAAVRRTFDVLARTAVSSVM
ncbi:wax ester/triacylglycerol synthase domain-containing protein [Actinoplanes sp. TBRC 11911]|uniref:wax ester/triacylglycerol synthase domain-containing protein n=1 Tax=Actinoplanes sp. TBRC 11911 TaxID=2729386 RepID=UPI00249F195F|nr:wax ester/triacylglycerol synthase domain-containing protein [Actinoplanes sp. TBRC 11911]